VAYAGGDGGDAKGSGNNGKAARTKRIMVPLGTTVKEIRRVYVFDDDPVMMDSVEADDATSNLRRGEPYSNARAELLVHYSFHKWPLARQT
jgi:GTPase involved in cell partitioning and DNA repair